MRTQARPCVGARAGNVSSSDPFGLRDFRAREDPPVPGSPVRVRKRAWNSGLRESALTSVTRSLFVACLDSVHDPPLRREVIGTALRTEDGRLQRDAHSLVAAGGLTIPHSQS